MTPTDTSYITHLLAVPVIWLLAGCGSPPCTNTVTEVPADTLRILAYNIHHGEGMDDVVDLERIATLIQGAGVDVLTLKEVDSLVSRTDAIDQATTLGKLTGMAPVFAEFMPYQGGKFGTAVLSRWPIAVASNIQLPDGEEPRSALSLIVVSPKTGRHVRITGIHLYMTTAKRLAQAASLEDGLRADSLQSILAGDFNSEPGDSVMSYLDDRRHVVPKGEDHLTFSSFDPVMEIDFVLLRPRDRFKVIRHFLLDEPVIPDHRPLVADQVIR